MAFLVIKCGGSVLDRLPGAFFEDVLALHKEGSARPVIVHGGGPKITDLLNKLQIPSVFHDGMRVTTPAVLDVVEMVLNGTINKAIVSRLTAAGGRAIGLSGIDGGLLSAEPFQSGEPLGAVGRVAAVNTDLVHSLVDLGYIPVISPIAADGSGRHFNVNGDMAAAALAAALDAPLCLVSDVPGIIVEKNGRQTVLETATPALLERLIASQAITGGMVAKVRAALESLDCGARAAVIMDGRRPGALLDFANGLSVGTRIQREVEAESHAS